MFLDDMFIRDVLICSSDTMIIGPLSFSYFVLRLTGSVMQFSASSPTWLLVWRHDNKC